MRLFTNRHKEGQVAKFIEKHTSQMASDRFLWAAGGAVLLSLAFQIAKRKNASNFVGQWAPTLLILGLYNKIVKRFGSE